MAKVHAKRERRCCGYALDNSGNAGVPQARQVRRSCERVVSPVSRSMEPVAATGCRTSALRRTDPVTGNVRATCIEWDGRAPGRSAGRSSGWRRTDDPIPFALAFVRSTI